MDKRFDSSKGGYRKDNRDNKNRNANNQRYSDNRKQYHTDNEAFSVEDEGIVVGRNAVRELLKSERAIDKIFVQRGEREGSIVVLAAEATSRRIPLVEVEKAKLDKMTNFAVHQGVVGHAVYLVLDAAAGADGLLLQFRLNG